MEHIYTIKVKRKFDPRDQYPSERRYSASTVFGFAWVHLALAFTSLLLTSLALYNPNTVETVVGNLPQPRASSQVDVNITLEVNNDTIEDASIDKGNVDNVEDTDPTDELRINFSKSYTAPLIIAPCLMSLGAFAAGIAAVVASRRWYVDHSITWFFLSSVVSSILSLTALCIIAVWIAKTSESGLSFCDYFSDGNLFGKVRVEADFDAAEDQNTTLYYVIKVPLDDLRAKKIPLLGEDTKENQSRKVLSINILIAACVELIWSLLSLKISWNGMRSDYPDDDAVNNRRGGGTVQVVTEIKGNNTKHLPKNTKILPPQPDLIEHYPKNNKIKKFFQTQQENGGYFLRTNPNENGLTVIGDKNDKFADFSQRESSAEYRERMMNFLNKCASSGALEAPDSYVGLEPGSVCASDIGNSPEDESKSVPHRSINSKPSNNPNRLSAISWGDIHDHTIYDQNTLDLDAILRKVRLPKADSPLEDVAFPNNDTENSNEEQVDNIKE